MQVANRPIDRHEFGIALGVAAAAASGAIAGLRLETVGFQNLLLAGMLVAIVFRLATFTDDSRSRGRFVSQLLWIAAGGMAICQSVFGLDARALEPLILSALALSLTTFMGFRRVRWLVPGCTVALPVLLSLLAISTPIAQYGFAAALSTATAVAAAAAAFLVVDRFQRPYQPSAMYFLAASLALLASGFREERFWLTGAILLVAIALVFAGDVEADSGSSQISAQPPVLSNWMLLLAIGTGSAAVVAAAISSESMGWPVVGAIGAGIVGLAATTFDADRADLDRLQQLKLAALESRIDALTGLSNRRGIEERLGEEMSRAQRYGHPLSILMIDLDDFKSINDRFGHAAGDEILRQIAGTIEASVRSIDVAGRYGGEEFLVLLPETVLGGAENVAERIRVSVEDSGMATVSIGLAQLNPDAPDSTNLVNRADDALYVAKRAGKNRIELAR